MKYEFKEINKYYDNRKNLPFALMVQFKEAYPTLGNDIDVNDTKNGLFHLNNYFDYFSSDKEREQRLYDIILWENNSNINHNIQIQYLLKVIHLFYKEIEQKDIKLIESLKELLNIADKLI